MTKPVETSHYHPGGIIKPMFGEFGFLFLGWDPKHYYVTNRAYSERASSRVHWCTKQVLSRTCSLCTEPFPPLFTHLRPLTRQNFHPGAPFAHITSASLNIVITKMLKQQQQIITNCFFPILLAKKLKMACKCYYTRPLLIMTGYINIHEIQIKNRPLQIVKIDCDE